MGSWAGGATSSTAGPSSGRLIVSRATDPRKLAGAIANRLRAAGDPSVVVASMGPEANYCALRSLAMAGEYLQHETTKQVYISVRQGRVGGDILSAESAESESASGDVEMLFSTRLAIVGRRRSEAARRNGEEGSAARSAAVTKENPANMSVAKLTNVGKAASVVAKFLDEEGYRSVNLHTLGAAAATQALKTVIAAQRYLAHRDSEDLQFTPRLVKTFSGEGKPQKTVEVVLRCRAVAMTP